MPPSPSEFDAYAKQYDTALHRGISLSGENKDYFARERIRWLGRQLARMRGGAPQHILDYGCGTGSATPYLLDQFPGASLLGVDVSEHSLAVAREKHGSDRAQFDMIRERSPAGDMDIAFCNGVFHHIPLDERAACMEYVFRSLRPGGIFAFWENNPWNLGTQIVMARIPFDRDAIKVSPPEARRLARAAGFDILETTYLFVFPRFLAPLRKFEPFLARWPIGAQYETLARRPA